MTCTGPHRAGQLGSEPCLSGSTALFPQRQVIFLSLMGLHHLTDQNEERISIFLVDQWVSADVSSPWLITPLHTQFMKAAPHHKALVIQWDPRPLSMVYLSRNRHLDQAGPTRFSPCKAEMWTVSSALQTALLPASLSKSSLFNSCLESVRGFCVLSLHCSVSWFCCSLLICKWFLS